MELRLRVKYFLLIIVIIIIGLLSREFTIILLWVGDVLWANMVYFIARFLYLKSSVKLVSLTSLVFCYAIEFSQLYKAEWIDRIRHTLFDRLVLGDTFLRGDLLSCTLGIVIAIWLDRQLLRNILSSKFPKKAL